MFCSWGIPNTNILFLRYYKHKHFVPEAFQTQIFCSWGIPNTNILFQRYSIHKHFVPELFQTQTFSSSFFGKFHYLLCYTVTYTIHFLFGSFFFHFVSFSAGFLFRNVHVVVMAFIWRSSDISTEVFIAVAIDFYCRGIFIALFITSFSVGGSFIGLIWLHSYVAILSTKSSSYSSYWLFLLPYLHVFKHLATILARWPLFVQLFSLFYIHSKQKVFKEWFLQR